MKKLLPLPVLLALLLPAPASSAMLRVPDDYPTIQAGLDAAAFGDTVLVAPGIYSDYEIRGNLTSCAFLVDGVLLASEQGPETTRIDMLGMGGGNAAVVYGLNLPSDQTVLSGFTITGAPPFGTGAVFTGGRMTVRDCRFVDLDTGAQTGALRATSDVHVVDCEFVNCVGTGAGAIDADRGITMTGSKVLGCIRPIRVSNEGGSEPILIAGCEFIGNDGGAVVVDVHPGEFLITDCRFDANVAGDAGGALLVAGPGLIDGCLFQFNSAPSGGAILVFADCTVTGNTFYGNHAAGGAAILASEADLTFERNIVSGSTGSAAVVASETAVTSGCNVFWDNVDGHIYEDGTYVLDDTDLVIDPQFCGADEHDFSLAASSVCLPANGVLLCGQIGALGAGCPGLGTVATGVASAPMGLDVVVDGESAPAPRVFNWIPGADHTVEVSTVVEEEGRRYDFVRWSDDELDAVRTIVVPDTPTLYTALYDSLFYLDMRVQVPGEGTVTPLSGYLRPQTMLTITAHPAPGFFFDLWTGEGEGYEGTDSSVTIQMRGPITETAHFSTNVDVTLATDPSGLTVLVDGEELVAPVTRSWERGSQHVISTDLIHEEPGIRRVFDRWSDGLPRTHTITVPGSAVVLTATFLTDYYLSFEPTPNGELNPGDGWRDAGSIVEIEAIENPYYLFTEWEGTGAGSYSGPDNPATITMNGPVHEEAHFLRNAQEVTLSLSDTDPFVHSGPPVGLGNVWLWYVCSTEGGFSRLEAELAGTMAVFAFLPEPGILNGGVGPLLEITSTECQSGSALLGAILVQDSGGELSLVPRSDTGHLRTHDCSTPAALPFEWPLDLEITNVRTDGGAVASSGRGCDEDAPTAAPEPTRTASQPEALVLHAPRPNPLRGGGGSRFEFSLDGPATVNLAVFDVTGRQVAVHRPQAYSSGGVYSIDWDPGLRSAGVYYVRLTTDSGRSAGTRWVLVR